MRELPVEPGVAVAEACSLITKDKQKAAFAANCPTSEWRPTDLCATVLLSFQGANTNVWPGPNRINDRIVRAKRQSQRRLCYRAAQL